VGFLWFFCWFFLWFFCWFFLWFGLWFSLLYFIELCWCACSSLSVFPLFSSLASLLYLLQYGTSASVCAWPCLVLSCLVLPCFYLSWCLPLPLLLSVALSTFAFLLSVAVSTFAFASICGSVYLCFHLPQLPNHPRFRIQ